MDRNGTLDVLYRKLTWGAGPQSLSRDSDEFSGGSVGC